MTTLQKQIPVQYSPQPKGLERSQSGAYNYDKIGMGYAGKSDFTDSKNKKHIPGPIYNHHEVNSLANQSLKNH